MMQALLWRWDGAEWDVSVHRSLEEALSFAAWGERSGFHTCRIERGGVVYTNDSPEYIAAVERVRAQRAEEREDLLTNPYWYIEVKGVGLDGRPTWYVLRRLRSEYVAKEMLEDLRIDLPERKFRAVERVGR